MIDKIKAKLTDTTGMFTGISFGISFSAYLEKKLKTKEIADALEKSACSANIKQMVLQSFEKLFDNSRKVLFPDIDRRNQWFSAITSTYSSRIEQLNTETVLTPELEASFDDIAQSMTAGAIMTSVVAYQLVKTKAHLSLQQFIVQERPDLIPRYASLLDRDVALRANKQVWDQWEVARSLYDSEAEGVVDIVWHDILSQKTTPAGAKLANELPVDMLP